jgi:hypothetical protein
MPDPPALLAKLIDGGFIAPKPALSLRRRQRSRAGPAAAPTEQDQLIMKNTMRYAEHFLDEVLGPDADMLSEAIDRCKTLPGIARAARKNARCRRGHGQEAQGGGVLDHCAGAVSRAGRRPRLQPRPERRRPRPCLRPHRRRLPRLRLPRPLRRPRRRNPPSRRPCDSRGATSTTISGPTRDMLMEPIEKCKTAAELRARIEKTRDTLANVAGKRKAEEFWNGILPRLPQA